MRQSHAARLARLEAMDAQDEVDRLERELACLDDREFWKAVRIQLYPELTDKPNTIAEDIAYLRRLGKADDLLFAHYLGTVVDRAA